MKFFDVQTLREISLVEVAVDVCNNFETCLTVMPGDKLKHACRVHDHWNYNFCEKCTETTKKRISQFQLPIELEKEVAGLFRHVYREVITWNCGLLEIHSKILAHSKRGCSCFDNFDLNRSLRWKSNGTINEKDTVRNLLQDGHLDTCFRFFLSCYFCSESDVTSLWEMMPEITKLDIRSNTCASLPVVSYWLKWLDGSVTAADSMSVIRRLLESDRKFDSFISDVALFHYFLNKCSTVDRRNFCLHFVSSNVSESPELIRFCLSEIDEKQEEIILRNNPWAVLNSFLDWPWQRHFMKLANRMWTLLQEGDYASLIWRFHLKISARWNDFDYVTLLTEFWDNSPTHLKQYVRNQRGYILKQLIDCLETNYGFYDFH
ncbi:hypothetical protein AVEN_30356-1 [Araneus ventricosus]|uniref:Uncharacterized protein n=1 Tax=Araneus ventricosus TaxID=182803 RepID=A0A4Y2MTA0_ARAVE|nr:hypothetical protein AVEN_30356-1 [Araneus ventricosus]